MAKLHAPVHVFSGAGISGSAPASLPSGNALRDVALGCCARAAAAVYPAVASVPKGSIPTANWKLEYVLGRINASAGPQALALLEALRVPLPNEAHMLCAAALAFGGVHVTVNLDPGVEAAYSLLDGSRALPSYAAGDFQACLTAWQALMPPVLPRLTVLASTNDFANWAARPQLPILAKLHGSLGELGAPPVEPVVSDFAELLELSVTRRAALDAALNHPLLIIGYSGGDGDCYQPLLRALRAAPFRWLDTVPSPRLRADLAAVADGQPEVGTAVSGLRSHGSLAQMPAWPEIDLGSASRVDAHVTSWQLSLSETDLADAYAWMLLDARHCDLAAELSLAVWRQTANRRALRRFADARFHEGGEANKREAARAYRYLLRPGPSAPGERTHALERYGSSFRAIALTTGTRVDGLRATCAPVAAWLLSWPDRAGPESRSGARAVLAHYLLRFAEVQMATGHRRTRAFSALTGAFLLRPRAGGPRSGHRDIYGRLQTLEVRALLAIATGRRSHLAGSWLDQLAVIERVYEDMNNPMGVANARAAAALAAAAMGAPGEARAWLLHAAAHYGLGGRTDPSGEALVARRQLIIGLWRVR